jgi:SecD/SecF fusion protein
MSDRRRHGFVLLLVLGLLAASVVVIASRATVLGLDLKGGVQLVYQAQPSPQTPKITQAALNQAVDIMQSRVDQIGVSQPEIQTSGGNEISVGLPDVHNVAQAEQDVGTTTTLSFYDWEANALAPNGKTVAAQLLAQNPTALTISQGDGDGAGVPGAGSMDLYRAVRQAATQTPAPYSKSLSRLGSQYYLFGAPGSQACATVARLDHTIPVQHEHCYLTGGQEARSQQALQATLPAGVSLAGNEELKIPQGCLVLQAASPNPARQIMFGSPGSQYFVLRDHLALKGSDITNPQASTDANGQPDVQFGLDSHGAQQFQQATAAIARRGSDVSLGTTKLYQHFATTLDNRLLTVPEINFEQYQDGIIGNASEIDGGFTTTSAQTLASQLRLGALPIDLKRISESQVSATLGAQALRQGLIAGAVGLAVVMLFLLFYYRVLGVIATSTLIIYALYFYALIKLIPITLTLPGIAGLILTIGVAADANIVIFERVKEEIRAGRSIRAGIITGYKKGLTAIIDANVVTIMTAFILFVLATAEVQGFAFTLGIGTIVSLFTAVLATQAILMTAGDSRTIARPSAPGAGKPKRQWRFDFMGASRYFFSMSGLILLVGALAIGGRGLHLGIDFTSGTRITTSLIKPATEAQVSAVATKAGAFAPTVQKIGKTGETFQISFKKGPDTSSAVRDALTAKYGIQTKHGSAVFDSSSVGPTFGRTIAHSAVVAIIASLLVISAYVALRFDWKFAVPVLIALMHDLLITAGVYALLGREVTVDTVAALLTILGYSLYDTIIVFDRVRENISRMPRAAFSQIVNRSMSEVLTRSIATTSCTLLPILALLLFGGSTLRDFAFALVVGVASGAYSSIFIASPVLTHWKEREPTYRHRRARILAHQGLVPAYAEAGADTGPARERIRRRSDRLSEPDPENVSATEFEQMKRDLDIESGPTRGTSTLAKRLAHGAAEDDDAKPATPPASSRVGSRRRSQTQPTAPPSKAATPPPVAAPPQASVPRAEPAQPPPGGETAPEEYRPAPDEAENNGMVQQTKPPPTGKPRNRRHGRRS